MEGFDIIEVWIVRQCSDVELGAVSEVDERHAAAMDENLADLNLDMLARSEAADPIRKRPVSLGNDVLGVILNVTAQMTSRTFVASSPSGLADRQRSDCIENDRFRYITPLCIEK